MTSTAVRGRAKAPRRRSRHRTYFYSLLMPAFIITFLLVAYPLARTMWMSLHEMNLMRPATVDDFVGLAHYKRMFTEPQFYTALRVSLIYTTAVTVGAFVIGMLAALLLHKVGRGTQLLRTAVIIPWAIPGVIVGFMFLWMFNTQFGVVNGLLTRIVPGFNDHVGWLLRPKTALLVVIMVAIYKTIPMNFLLFFAGRQAVPDDLYEAASVDGANAWQKFRYITWPGLAHVRLIAILLTSFYAFREFGQIFVVTGGGPSRQTETLAVQVYLEGLERFHFGYASALGVFMIGLALIFAILMMRAIRTDFFN